MFLISHNKDPRTGFRLAGVDGVITRTPADTAAALKKAAADPAIGILLITEGAAEMCPAEVERLRKRTSPLIVEIPGANGGGNGCGRIASCYWHVA